MCAHRQTPKQCTPGTHTHTNTHIFQCSHRLHSTRIKSSPETAPGTDSFGLRVWCLKRTNSLILILILILFLLPSQFLCLSLSHTQRHTCTSLSFSTSTDYYKDITKQIKIGKQYSTASTSCILIVTRAIRAAKNLHQNLRFHLSHYPLF